MVKKCDSLSLPLFISEQNSSQYGEEEFTMAYIENPRGHIVFDCDGTLISSIHALYEGVQYVIGKELGREVSLDEAITNYSSDVYQIALNFGLDPKADEELKDRLIRLWGEFAELKGNGFRLFPEIKSLLLELTAKDYQLYVWTARDRRSTLSILKELGVAKFFLDFRCLDDCDPKPNPVGIKQMVGDIDKSKVIMIGDSFADIMGAKKFGCRSIAACWASSQIEAHLLPYGPEGLAKTPKDCLKLIEKLLRG